jgi:SAM-dependent methyltransferase
MGCNYQKYHDYLLTGSKIARIYRSKILYPKAFSCLSGEVLDVGCGIGNFLEWYPGSIGVDINPYNVAYCRKRFPGRAFMLNDLATHRSPMDRFDAVVLDNVIEHIEDSGSCIDFCLQWLKPSGTLVIGVPGRKGYSADPDHKQFYDLERISLLEQKHLLRTYQVVSAPLWRSHILSGLLKSYVEYYYMHVRP